MANNRFKIGIWRINIVLCCFIKKAVGPTFESKFSGYLPVILVPTLNFILVSFKVAGEYTDIIAVNAKSNCRSTLVSTNAHCTTSHCTSLYLTHKILQLLPSEHQCKQSRHLSHSHSHPLIGHNIIQDAQDSFSPKLGIGITLLLQFWPDLLLSSRRYDRCTAHFNFLKAKHYKGSSSSPILSTKNVTECMQSRACLINIPGHTKDIVCTSSA
mmetsp:Transcript_5667/g.35228  ORF Transcript_5667/g.35228 Transcript_5667/m.35228 type:complete len:213 (-) Transcript_5667:1754-2392(-)